VSEVFEERDEVPTVEVRVFRHGELIHTELCESEEQASLVIEGWSELDGVECEMNDLTDHHRPDEILEPEPAELREEDYPDQREIDRRTRSEF
jgi:hypothetical protein